jgi:hypothetical protein
MRGQELKLKTKVPSWPSQEFAYLDFGNSGFFKNNYSKKKFN